MEADIFHHALARATLDTQNPAEGVSAQPLTLPSTHFSFFLKLATKETFTMVYTLTVHLVLQSPS
jgi:hypothetical protein